MVKADVPFSKETTRNQKISKIPIVGVGASAGGLEEFKRLFQNMPVDTGMTFVLVQHLDPTHESMMVELLGRYTAMPVVEILDAMLLVSNHIYVIPPNKDLTIKNGKLFISKPSKSKGLRLPIDVFFQSLAEDEHERATGIILSGTGSDGTLGLKAIKGYGGMVMVQSPNQAQYDGMPTSAIASGAVDYVLPVEEMSSALINYVQHSHTRGFFGTDLIDTDEIVESVNNILAIIHEQLGHNMYFYKKNTLVRRIRRRISLKQLDNLDSYANFLRNNPGETVELFKDMLIGVTNFFRDPESWSVLEQQFLDTKGLDKGQSIRIWVPGCSTGEEAYSLGILLQEYMERHQVTFEFQIFATDIDSNALAVARNAIYPENIALSLTPTRLRKYFIKEDGLYRVSPHIRENIIFSEQNLICDPPFCKLDLVSCRNLLIYLESSVQEKIIDMFHFSLKPSGYLMLGGSETIGLHTDLFDVTSKKWRLFKKINNASRTRVSFPILPRKPNAEKPQGLIEVSSRLSIQIPELAKHVLLSEYVPASILINRKHQVVYHFGETTDYLRYPTGESTNDLFSLLRDGLLTRVRGAVHKAFKNNIKVEVCGARVKRKGHFHAVSFKAKPLEEFDGGNGLLLLSFEEQKTASSNVVNYADIPEEDEPIVKQLEYELRTAKEQLQNTIEELETSNEELKASSEEVMLVNEGLQSSNEELETSKEELQSLNEELNLVNNKLHEKVLGLETSNNDLTNLMNSSRNASIFLDSTLNVKFFTPASKSLFNLITTDIGRPISDIVPSFDDPELVYDIEDVMETLRLSSREVKDKHGHWYNRRIMPYRTSDNRILGTVISFDDISNIKESLIVSQSLEEWKSLILDHVKERVLCFDANGKLNWGNKSAEGALGKSHDELLGLTCSEVWQPISGASCEHCPVTRCLEFGEASVGEIHCDKKRWVYASPLINAEGKNVGIVEFRKDLEDDDE